MSTKWGFLTNQHVPEPGFTPAPLLPPKPHRPTGEPPRCRACGKVLSGLGGHTCDAIGLHPLNARLIWDSIIDYAYGLPPKAVTR